MCCFVIFAILTAAFSIAYLHDQFSEDQALTMVFGNYDPIQKTSVWKKMEFPSKEDVDEYFWKSRAGIVSSVFYQAYKENGKKKFFLLTKTIPLDIPYICHACLPLLGATGLQQKEYLS